MDSNSAGARSAGRWYRSGNQIIIDLRRPAARIDREVLYEDLPRVTVELRWHEHHFTRAKLEESKGLGGGVYIATDASDVPLKVGVTDDFARRAGQYGSEDSRNEYRKRAATKGVTIPDSRGWYFHIAKITSAEGDVPRLVRGYGIHVENAIARALLRAKYRLPAHVSPVAVAKVLGRVEIKNLLPSTLLKHLRTAYQANMDVRGKDVTTYVAPSPPSNSLLLTPTPTGKRLTWELE